MNSLTGSAGKAYAPPDAAIRALLVRWADALRRGVAAGKLADDFDFYGLMESDSLLEQLMAIPAATVEGLAIKSYLALHHELGGAGMSGLEICWSGSMMNDTQPQRALIADAMRLSPLLANTVGLRFD